MQFEFQAAIVRALGRCVEEGLVYKGKKPVYWCISDRTALAEAEVEYADHSSPSIYVEFKLDARDADALAARVPALAGRDVSVLIWTTTPWTIPSNLGIAFQPGFDYAAYDVDGRLVIVAEALAEATFAKAGRTPGAPVARMKGDVFERIRFVHPLYARESLGVLADYVTLEQGTGAVHTAPGHGADDFNTGQRYGLDTYAPDRAVRRVPRERRAVCRPEGVGRQPEGGRGAARARRAVVHARSTSTATRTAGAATSR